MKKYKNLLLLTLLISCFSQAGQEQAIVLFDAGNFDQAKKQFELLVSEEKNRPKALMYLARIALENEDIDDAEDLIKKARKISPNDPKIQFFYGVVNGEIAQQASIFTALGYAKKTRKAFAKAVELEPDNIKYHQALLSYHVAAPSIAGGDKEIALEQANVIKSLDEKQGLKALISVYTATDNENSLIELYKNIPEKFISDPDIYIGKAFFYQRNENFIKALDAFRVVVKQAAEIEGFQNSKFQAVYQIGRNSVLSKSNIEEGIESLTFFIDKAPADENLASKEWAKFRLANLIELKGEVKQARTLYKGLKQLTKDKRLLKAIKKAL